MDGNGDARPVSGAEEMARGLCPLDGRTFIDMDVEFAPLTVSAVT
jgi:hypothetical protein